jgi:methionyl aminopeptidase
MIAKTPQDITKLRKAGALLARVLRDAQAAAIPGVILEDLDKQIHAWITAAGATPSFLGHQGYRYTSCLSVNEQVVHGIPSSYVLQKGDVLGIDVGLWLDGVCVDAARTEVVGMLRSEAPNTVQHLLDHTQEALKAGMAAAKPGRRVGSIGAAVQDVADRYGLGIVRALCGHGVGKAVWEAPEVPNYGRTSDGPLLRVGQVLAIEPMLTLGGGDVVTLIDGWTVASADGSLAAQMEETVLITKSGVEVLTR